MKKLALAAAAVFALFTGTASAADMAVKSRPVVAPVPVFSWTGFYIGIHGGGAWFDKEWDELPDELKREGPDLDFVPDRMYDGKSIRGMESCKITKGAWIR